MALINTVYPLRVTAPALTDKNFLHYSHGGYNYCIPIRNGVCMPNCTGYAWGRWRELLGAYHNLSRADAEKWWGTTNDGYERGRTPKEGAVACWYGDGEAAGHVAIVEKVQANGSIVISQSNYNGINYETLTLNAYNNYRIQKDLQFQGFIYLPNEYVNEANINEQEDDIMRAWRFIRNEDEPVIHWFDGCHTHTFSHPDEAYIINDIYKEEYGTDVPSRVYPATAPWATRVRGASGNTHDMDQLLIAINKVAGKVEALAQKV